MIVNDQSQTKINFEPGSGRYEVSFDFTTTLISRYLCHISQRQKSSWARVRRIWSDIITVSFINPTIITVLIKHINQNIKKHACLDRFSTPHDIYQTQVWNRQRQLWHCDHQQWHRGGLRRVSGFSESAISKLDLDTEAMFNFRLWNQIEYISKSTKAFRPQKKLQHTYHVNHDLMFFSRQNQ